MSRIISLATIDRIFLHSTGCTNIDIASQVELGKILEQLGTEIIEIAVMLQKRSGRKTIKDKDIRLAFDFFKQNQLKKVGRTADEQ